MNDSVRLPFRPLFCYSIGNVTLTAIYGYLGAFLLKYYSDHVHLDPAWIGWAFLVRSVVDAAVDPLIGFWSDRSRFSQGRRRPFFLIGSIPAALLFYWMMTPPDGSQFLIFIYLTVTSTLMVCFLSLMGISHLALGFELTTDYDERTRLFGYKNLVENLTTLVATFSVPLALLLSGYSLAGHELSRADCYCLAAAALAVLSVVAALVAYFGTSERPTPSDQQTFRFVDGVVAIIQNRAFLILLGVFVLMTIADRVTSAELFIVLEHFHGLKEEDSLALLVGLFAGALISVWPWVWLAQRYGKDIILRLAIALWPITCIAFVARQWTMVELCAITFGMGVFGTGMITILGAIVPDVLEYDRHHTSQRREGMYVSIGNLVYQIAMGVGFLIAGQTLHAIGYRGESEVSPNLVLGLRVTYAAVPTVLAMGASLALVYFPISKRSYQELVECRESHVSLAPIASTANPEIR
ncbi:MFS transporter [Schlesneria paludicola]|uniref:MFS transporter n=1 Tax=Schlesneria paludicola TaxID=360056 RepID=UPI00029ABB76|nr:MFS transporter [Schlesneria paludicola]